MKFLVLEVIKKVCYNNVMNENRFVKDLGYKGNFMANDKFKVLKVINHQEWLKSCPLFIVRSQLILNNESGKLLLVNEMANIGVKAVKSVIIKVECKNAEGGMIGVVDNCAYQDLNVAKQAVFGGNKLFGMPDGTDSVSIIIKKIVFADDTVWNNDYLLKGIQVDNPIRIDPSDVAYDVVATRCKENNITPKFWPHEFVGGWRCTCAQINDEDNMVCSLCGISKFWVLDNLNREDIIDFKERAEREARLRREREEEEARLAAQREEEERRRAEEEARLAAQREEEERRRAEEEARLAAEREAEERRLAAEREAEERRQAELRAIEEAKRAEEERKAAEERARIEVLNAKKEAVRQYNMQQTRKSAAKNVKYIFIGIVAVIACFGIYELAQFIRINDRYESAQAYVRNYDYESAIKVYKNLGDYKDSQQMVLETKYQYAEYLSVVNRYQESVNLYTELGTYKNSQQMVPQIYLKWGNYARENQQYAEAFTYYELAGSAVDAQVFIDTKYEYADSMMENGAYQDAIEMFNQGDGRPGTQAKIGLCYYNLGKVALEQSRFDDAIAYFKNAYGVEDANELNKRAYYMNGNKMLAANNIEEAYDCFVNAGNYEDAEELKLSLSYDMALIRMEQGNINAAILFFKNVELTEEIQDVYNEAMYKYAESMISQNVDEKVLGIYQELPEDYENAKDRIAMITKYIDYIGTYVCDEEDATVKSVVVTLAIVNDEVVMRVNGEEIDADERKSDTCSITSKDKLKFTDTDGNTFTYEK